MSLVELYVYMQRPSFWGGAVAFISVAKAEEPRSKTR